MFLVFIILNTKTVDFNIFLLYNTVVQQIYIVWLSSIFWPLQSFYLLWITNSPIPWILH